MTRKWDGTLFHPKMHSPTIFGMPTANNTRYAPVMIILKTKPEIRLKAGFIRVGEMSGKFNFFQGQGIVREFYVVSGNYRYLLKCQGNVREFIISILHQMMRNRKLLGQFS